MKTRLASLIALLLALFATSAEARPNWRDVHPSAPSPLRLVQPTSLALAALTQGFVLGMPWCFATGTIIAVTLRQRELRRSEVYAMLGSCIVPILGGLIVLHVFKQHPEWDVYTAEERAAVGRDRLGIGSQS